MRRNASLCLLISAIALFSGSGSAWADEASQVRAQLGWVRDASADQCIDGPTLRQAVNRRWGRQVFYDDDSATIVVKGKVGRRTDGAWFVHLELERTDGTKLGSRDIVTHARDCSSLDDSVALALGIMLDLTEQRASQGEAQIPAAKPAAASPPITIPKETIAPRVPWRVEPTIGGEAAIGILPGVALGGRLQVAIEPPRLWRIEAGATLFQHRSTNSGAAGARFSMWTADIAICPVAVDRETFAAWGCVAQRAGRIHSEGVGFDRNASADDTFLAAELRAGATWSFAPPFSVHAAFGLEAPLVRLRFVYREGPGSAPAVYEMAPVAGVLGLGIGARF